MSDLARTIDGVRALCFTNADPAPCDGAIAVIASLVEPKLTPNERVMMLVRVEQKFTNIVLTSDDARRLGAALVTAADVAAPQAVALDPLWSWSSHDERWNNPAMFATREEAIAEGNTHTKEGATFWTGQHVPVTAEDVARASDMRDFEDTVYCHLNDNFCEEAAEAFSCTTEQAEELDAEVEKVVLAWVKRHNLTPEAWTVAAVQGHVACGGGCTDIDCEYCEGGGR